MHVTLSMYVDLQYKGMFLVAAAIVRKIFCCIALLYTCLFANMAWPAIGQATGTFIICNTAFVICAH